MAKKRARAQKKRADYRKGGRVAFQTGGFTQADIDQAVADLNSGAKNADQIGAQYGFTGAEVTAALADINKASGYTAPAPAPAPVVAPAPAPAAAAPAPAPAPVAATPIPAPAPAGTPLPGTPQSNINPVTGLLKPTPAAGGPSTQEEFDQIQAGGMKTLTNPATGATMEVLANDPRFAGMTDAQQIATVFPPAAAPPAATFNLASIPADGDYTGAEAAQVIAAINAGTITADQAATRFGVTADQITAEVGRSNQVAAGQAPTAPDPFADTTMRNMDRERDAAAAKARLDAADAAQLANVDVSTKADGTAAAGAFIKDYDRVNPSLLFDDRTTAKVSPTAAGTVTATPDIEQLDDYEDITPPENVPASTFTAATAALAQAAKAGVVSPGSYNAFLADVLNSPQFATDLNRPPVTVDEIRELTKGTQAAQFSLDQATSGLSKRTTDVGISDSSFIDKVNLREDVNLSATPDAEKQTRAELTGTAADSEAAKITDSIGYDAYQRRTVTGIAAQDAAIKFTAETAGINSNLAQSIIQDPATVTAQIDNEPPEVIAAIAALPPEALVSSQMETLLAGMESGTIPTWARPAVDSINQRLAQRGMDVSTVGRDALFNAVIQSALPIAQSNAQALQARATQNLSNEQQANLQRAQTEANRRSNNLANRQTAESQTAQFSQNLKVLQSQFTQERDTLSFQQQQEQRLVNLQNQQRTAELNAQNENASVAQNLGNSQQIELANLEIQNQSEQQNMSAANQERLAEMQVAADFISKNAAFDQQMKTANLSNDQQMRLANLTSRNQAGSENLSAAQQTELANLNARMQTNITSANIAAQMGTALLNADQQRAVENASMVARMDLTKFSDAQQVELANSKFIQSMSLADFSARQQGIMQDATALAGLDLAAADQRTKLAVTQAQNFLQRDMTDLSNEQQALILDTQVEQQRILSNQSVTNAARQFNATSENQVNQFNASLASQIEQFNATQSNAMAQFNTAEKNRVAAINAGNAIDTGKFNNQIDVQIDTFNEQQDTARDQWNAANAQAIEQSNVQWRRSANTINTAAENATNQENAAKAFQISAADQNFMWQELRDEAAYLRQAYENEEQRTTTLYATAISNDVAGKGAIGISPILDLVKNLD